MLLDEVIDVTLIVLTVTSFCILTDPTLIESTMAVEDDIEVLIKLPDVID